MKRTHVILFMLILSSCSLPVEPSLNISPTSTLIKSITVSKTQTPKPSATFTPEPTPTPTPEPTPTLIPNEDLDNDGLTNLEEIIIYKTNPYSSDSDGDGIPDSDWEERREFVYSIQTIIKLRQPFDLASMNDIFQDVRVIEEENWGYTTIDLIIYPETKLTIIPSSYPLDDLDEDLILFTNPGISTNYSPEMQAAVLDIVESAKTDVEVVETILSWTEKNTSLADLPYQPEIFYFSYVYKDQVFLRNPPDLSPTRMLTVLFYANSMFEKQVHGTCCSTATFKCAMIKAAGIPCKTIQTLFPIFSHEDQTEPYENNLNRYWVNMFENQTSGKQSTWANHCFMEVYLGGQWIRVDNNINIYHGGEDWLSIKILSVSDLTEVDFSKTYPVDWIYNRPYYTLSIEDQEPIHDGYSN